MENILRECANRLISAANNLSSVGGAQSSSSASTTTATSTIVAPPALTASNIPSTTAVTSRSINTGGSTAASGNGSTPYSMAIDEHRRIFGYRPPTASARPSRRVIQSAARGRSYTTPYSRSSASYVPKNTVTKPFVCLSKRIQTVPPNAAERISLSLAGLGEKKITFEKNGDSQHFHDKILETFPALKNCGGYELLRISDGNSKTLIDVPSPQMGYTVNFLKSALGQAKAFLRPLQQNIPLEVEQLTESSNSPKVCCVNCNVQIAMAEMRQHENVCGGGPSNQLQESGSPVQSQITEFTSVDGTVTNEEKLQELQQLFPNLEENVLNSAIAAALGNVNIAANSLLLGKAGDACLTPQEPACNSQFSVVIDSDDNDIFLSESSEKQRKREISISSIVSSLSKKLTGQILKVYTDDEDLVSDALAVYKNKKFDASCPLRVKFVNQPAIHTGGPRREFYEKVYLQLTNGTNKDFQQFEVPPTRLVPTYNTRIVFSGIMKCIGKMIAHSISQCGIGISKLSPVCYWYLVYQDIDKAISYAEISDVHDTDAAECLNKIVNVKTEDDVKDLNRDTTFISILSDIGSTNILSLNNIDEIVQCILCHFVINKRKVLLDQLREGLKVLGVLDEMTKYPETLAPLFIDKKESLSSAFIKGILTFPQDTGDNDVRQMLLRFIDESSVTERNNFLCFVTGTSSVGNLHKIEVSFDAVGGAIYASTCMRTLQLPPVVQSYKCFEEAMKMVIINSGPSFNAI